MNIGLVNIIDAGNTRKFDRAVSLELRGLSQDWDTVKQASPITGTRRKPLPAAASGGRGLFHRRCVGCVIK